MNTTLHTTANTKTLYCFIAVWFVIFCCTLKQVQAQTPTVNCEFSVINGNNNPLTSCITEIEVTMYNINNADTIEFYLTHNVQVTATPNFAASNYTGNNGIHKLVWNIPSTSDTIKLTLKPISCKFFSDNFSLITNYASFQCRAISGNYSSYASYLPSGLIIANNNAVNYMIQTADISIVTNPTLNGVTYSSLVGVAGPQASIANRYTAIRWINTSLNSSFYYKINQETDASHIGLWAVLPGIDSILLSGTVSGSVYTYKLDTFLQNNPDFLINSANGDTGFVLLKQQVIRKCSGTNSSTTVYAEWTCTDCSPNPQSNSASLNVTVQVNNIIPQLSYTVSPSALSCNTTQTFEYRIRIANSTVQWLDSIIIPVDTGYFAIDEFYLQHDADTLHILPTQYGINSNGTTNKIHLKLQNLPVAPPGMFSGVSGLSGTINYLFNDTLFAVLKLHFKCNGYNQALQQCGSSSLQLATETASIRYKTYCSLVINPSTASLLTASLPVSINNTYSGFVQGYIDDTDIDLGLNSSMPIGFKLIASDSSKSPFALYGYGIMPLLNCDTITYYARLIVPNHISINEFNFLYNNADLFTIDASYISAEVVGYYRHYTIQYAQALGAYNQFNNTTYSTANAHITFNATYNSGCPFFPETFGIDTFFIQYRAQCGNCTDCYRSLGCQAVLLFIHCAETCGDAVTGTEAVELQRASFGWPSKQDYLNNAAPYQAGQLSALLTSQQFYEETHKLYTCDSVWLHATGFTVDTIDIYSLAFELSYMPPGGLSLNENIFTFMHGTATLISTDGTDTIQVTLNAPTLSIDYAASFDTLLILNFNLLNNQTADSLLNQHSYIINLDAYLRTTPPATLSAGAYFIPQIRGDFTNTNSDPVNFLTHSCDPWGDLITLLVLQVETDVTLIPVGHANTPQIFNIGTPWSMMNACTARTRHSLKISGGLGLDTDDYPYEFRPYVFFENLPQTSYGANNFMNLTSAYGYLPPNSTTNFNVVNNTVQLTQNYRALEKADPALTHSAFAWMLAHRRSCYNTTDTIHLSGFVTRAYADAACRQSITWNDTITKNYSCTDIPLSALSANSTVYTLADTTVVSIPFYYYYPSSNPQSPLPNVWFHYTVTGAGGVLPASIAAGSGNQVTQHPTLNGYGYFTFNGTHALSAVNPQIVKVKFPTPCAEGDTFIVTLTFGALCNDTLFHWYLNGTLIPDTVQTCNVCTDTINVIRPSTAALLVHQSFADSCGRIYWHLNVHNNSDAPVYTGTLLLRHPTALPFSPMHSSLLYNGSLTSPLNPSSFTYTVWNLFPGDTLPAIALNLTAAGADTIAPNHTVHYTLAFDVDCSFTADILQAMYAGFGLCENYFYFDTLNMLFSNMYSGTDTCCTNSLDAFDYSLINNCDTLGWLNILINDINHTFTAVLTNATGDTLYHNINLTYNNTPASYSTLPPGIYFLTITNNSTFITHTEAVVVDSVDAATCITCACTPGINIGAAGTEVYLSTLIANNTLPADTLSGGCLSISGTLHIDVNYTFSNMEIKMNPFAAIEIADDIIVLMDSMYINGCDTMWQQIGMNDGTYLNIKRSRIDDAYNAIVLKNNGMLILDSVRFHANEIGLSLFDSDVSSTDMNYSQHYISNCRFDCENDYLLPPFEPQTISDCGIRAMNHQLELYDYNEFRYMRNGIRGKDADIYISNNHFRHIRHNIGTQSSNEGIAIESHNDILCQLSVDGTIISANAPDDWTMNDCRIGVSLIKAHLSCTATRMRTMTRGIEITQCQYAKIKIVENYMECRQMGVFTYNSMPFGYFDAVRNEIIVNNPNTIGALASFGGVIVQGSGTNIESASNGNFNIIDNDITLNNSRYGILVSSCLGGRITDNSIMFNQLTPIRGIMLRQVNKFNLNCNVVNGIGQDELNNILGSVYLPAAYEFVNSTSVYFNCNSANRIYTGLAVFNNCSGSRYKANLFYRHKYGLYYGTGANSSPQSLHGNIFDIDTLTGSRFGAFGISNNPAFYNNINHYTVNPITNPFCNPMRIGRNNGAQIFSANQSGYWQNNGWFEQDPFGTNYECAFDSINCSDDIYRYRDMPDSLFNTNFTINPADSTIYEWDAARYLTEKILSDSTLLQDSLFSTYYNSLSGTSVIQFSEISRHIGRAYVLSSTDSASLTTLNTAYTITYTTYRQTDSLIRATGASGTLQTQRDSLRNVLRTYRFGLTQLHQQIDSARSMRLDSIEQINNQLQAGTVQSLNEQTLNQLRIRLNNKKAFTQAEQTLLYFIAMQCPYSGGASVYTARALYAVVNDTLDFMDHVLCGNEDWFFRKEETGANATTSVILYPNPAHHIINIAGLVADEENKVEIFNNMGIRISEAICTLSNLALDVSNYPNGVYIIKLSNSSLTESFKITINR